MDSRVPKPVSATQRKPQKPVLEPPAPEIPTENIPIVSSKTMSGREISSGQNKISLLPTDLPTGDFSFQLPTTLLDTLISSPNATIEQVAHQISPPETTETTTVVEEKTKSSIKFKKPISSSNITKTTTPAPQARPKAKPLAKTHENSKATPPASGGTALDNDTHSGIAERLLTYGAQMMASFPHSDNDDMLADNAYTNQGDAAMTDNPTIEETHTANDGLSNPMKVIFPSHGETSPGDNQMVVDFEPTGVEAEVPVVPTHDPDPLILIPPRDDPLTLSQLSPRKAASSAGGIPGGDDGNGGTMQTQREGAISPMRPSVKRRSSATSAEPGMRAMKPPGAQRAVSAAPRGGGARSGRGRGGARIVSAPVQSRKQPARKARELTTSSTIAPPRATSFSARPRITAAFTNAAPRNDKSTATFGIGSASLPLNTGMRKASVPVEFSVHSAGTQPEAQRPTVQDSGETQQPRPKPYTVPDFKAMHATLAAQNVLRRSQLAPTIPVPIAFSTDIRAKERELFDEKVREKERELEAAREVQRREREQEEARELKDLRKRAIPKAHEVPDWYKEAPKRNHGSGQ
ncbi:hypothetical protein C8R45DRAFT_990656 [Mycena sanguinolenta]|nr:hypothetical protein C8R45DRAFT_990656 [Mycena sanguinolenta]